MAGKPHTEPDNIESIAELKLRGHVIRLAVDSASRILFCDIYQYAHNGEVMLTDSGRLEGKPLAGMLDKLARPVYPGKTVTTPEPVQRFEAVEEEEDLYE